MSAAGTDLWRMGALELAGAIRSRQVSSREVIEAHLDRIEAVNPAVNAITVLLAIRRRKRPGSRPRSPAAATFPVSGRPLTVKENIDLAGTPTTRGFKALAGAYPGRDSPVVERLKAAGAIPVGRTNCPSGAVRWHTESELWGATINPWDRSLTPGASSGGEAAALATGMNPLGLGGDGLGSLRWPAQCCGISVLKPTLGRIPSRDGHRACGCAGRCPADDCRRPHGPAGRRPAGRVPAAGRTHLARPVDGARTVARHRTRQADPGRSGDRSGRQGTATQEHDGIRKTASALADAGYAVDEAEPPSVAMAAKTALDMLSTPDVLAFWQRTSSLLPADTQRFLVGVLRGGGRPGWAGLQWIGTDDVAVRVGRGSTGHECGLRAHGSGVGLRLSRGLRPGDAYDAVVGAIDVRIRKVSRRVDGGGTGGGGVILR